MVIKKESLSLDVRIRFLASDLIRLSKDLIKCDKEMDRAEGNGILRDIAVSNLANAIIAYTKAKEETIKLLEMYFMEEERDNKPRHFVFHRMYRDLTKA
jgi:hypothetical protein